MTIKVVQIGQLKEGLEKVRVLQANPLMNPKELISAQSKVPVMQISPYIFHCMIYLHYRPGTHRNFKFE